MRPRTPTHLSVCPQEPSSRGDHWGHYGAGVTVQMWGSGQWVWGRLYQGGPGRSPLTPPSQPARSPRGQDKTNYLRNCMVLKAPRDTRESPGAAACMTAPPGLPHPPEPLTASTKKGKKRIHKYIYIYPYQKKYIISEFARTFYHNMCLALPRTSINF